MVDIYVSLSTDGFITGWGKAEYGAITTNPDESILLTLDKNHDLFDEFGMWRYLNGELFKDDSQLIDNLKNAKKEELSQACQECILGGFTSKVNGVEYHFSYDKEAQTNLQERWQLFQNNMINSIIITAHNINDKSVIRVSVNKAQFDVIYLDSVKHKENCISRLHDALIPMIEHSSSIEQINNIHWDATLVEPAEPSIIVKDDKTIDKLLEKQKIEQIKGDSEVMNLAMMLMGMGGF